MRNMSKKTRKRVERIIENHFTKTDIHGDLNSVFFTPRPDSPLSAIWKKLMVRFNRYEIIGFLLDDKCAYMVAGAAIRRKVIRVIKSPKQLLHPICFYARQAKQIEYRLMQMSRPDMATQFGLDYAWLMMVDSMKGDIYETY